jgi:hypothetical protein
VTARSSRAALVLGILAVIVATQFGFGGLMRPAPAGAVTTPAVSVTLLAMTPQSPQPTPSSQPVTFTALVSNNSSTSYSDFLVDLQRGLPITQQSGSSGLDAAIAEPPSTDTLAAQPQDQNHSLPAHSTVSVTYRTTPDQDHMCLCNEAVYPYALVVQAQPDSSSPFVEVGRTQVLVPSFTSPPRPVEVAWVWPLIDRPHRGLSSTVFDDDELAASVSPGGRLYRALQVAVAVSGKLRLTLLIDPELIDGLATMAAPTGYLYRSGGKDVRGTGGPAARAWLDRLHSLQGRADFELTGYADPDVNAITRAGMSYSTALDSAVSARVTDAIGPAGTDLDWPAGGTLTSRGLDAVIASGASSVVLTDSALPGKNGSDPRPDQLSPLPSASGAALALVTDSAMEQTVSAALKVGALAADLQQTLLSQLAIRAVADPMDSHFVVLTPDRYVDTNPATAAATLLTTVDNSWTRAISIPDALRAVTPVDRGSLQTSAESVDAEVSPQQMADVQGIQQKVSSMRDALASSAAAQLLGGFDAGLQRAESSAWSVDPTTGEGLVGQLGDAIDTRLKSISLVQPAEGTYGLSSSDSPVIVTIDNKLPEAVTVRVAVTPDNRGVGFRSQPVNEVIPGNSRKTVRVPTHTERLGQFRVVASLTTPDGQQLGEPVELTLRSTAVGGITKGITIAAAIVLVAALARRWIRRHRHAAAAAAAAAAAR